MFVKSGLLALRLHGLPIVLRMFLFLVAALQDKPIQLAKIANGYKRSYEVGHYLAMIIIAYALTLLLGTFN